MIFRVPVIIGKPCLKDAGLDQEQIRITHLQAIRGKGLDVTGRINDFVSLLYEYIDKYRGITPLIKMVVCQYPDI